MKRRLLAAATALAAGALVAPAAAAAAMLDPIAPCYVSAGEDEFQRELIAVRGSGFSPLAPIDISIDGAVVMNGTASATGTVEANARAPYQQERARIFTLTVAERGNPVNTVTATTRVTELNVTLKPAEAPTWRRVRYRGRGFTADRPVYAHYVHDGEERKRVRLVKRPRGDCGRFSVKRRQIPVRRPATGEWIVQVDQQRRYEERPRTNVVKLPIHVRRVFREP